MSNSNTSAIEHDIAIGSHNLASRSFVALVITQFLTGINDNCFRWLVIGIGKYYIDADMLEMDQSTLLGVGLACFVSPYILLATQKQRQCSKRDFTWQLTESTTRMTYTA